MITDHYFSAKLIDPKGNPIPSEPFRTLQAALMFAEDQSGEIAGSIYYVEDEASQPRPMIRYVKGVPEEVPE